MSKRWPFLEHPGVLAFAHRGGASEAPENSMEAFAKAVGLGYTYLETDVHMTSDGVLLAFHDDRLDRVTDHEGLIGELPYRELSGALIDGREPIPLLEDLLGSFPDARFNLDPKHDSVVERLAETIERTGAVDRVCCGAFSDRRLERLRSLVGDRLCTSLGPKAIARLRGASYGLPAGTFPGGCVQVPHHYRGHALVDERFISRAHQSGLDVHVWTIDEPAEMIELLDLGVDGIMTDQPLVLKQVLTQREQWS